MDECEPVRVLKDEVARLEQALLLMSRDRDIALRRVRANITQMREQMETIHRLLEDKGRSDVLDIPDEGIALGELERLAIVQALHRTNWVQKEAAKLLKISSRKMNYKCTKHKLKHPTWRLNRGGKYS